eukprot:NODE_602_length_5512_cov_0.250693.p5 type:complete len:100 gc:universal NODE_602_length_5512_cov_0.250693:4117-3818(-)
MEPYTIAAIICLSLGILLLSIMIWAIYFKNTRMRNTMKSFKRSKKPVEINTGRKFSLYKMDFTPLTPAFFGFSPKTPAANDAKPFQLEHSPKTPSSHFK